MGPRTFNCRGRSGHGLTPFHEPERRTPMRLDGNALPTSRIGVRRSCKVHGPDARPKLEVGAAHELGRADLPVGQDARQRVPTGFFDSIRDWGTAEALND